MSAPDPTRQHRRDSSRRLDPTGKRALFETPVTAAPDLLRGSGRSDGRGALFSAGAREPGTVVVICSSCKARSRISVGDVAIRLAAFSRFDPLTHREHPHRITCPSCRTGSWCRIGWGD